MVLTKLQTLWVGFFFFSFPCKAYRNLVPQPGIEPRPWAAKAHSPNHWTAREFPQTLFGFHQFFL